MSNTKNQCETRQSLREKAEILEATLKKMEKEKGQTLKMLPSTRVNHYVKGVCRQILLKLAVENCKNETVLHWLRENSESGSFFRLTDMFHFLKKHIVEEEKKNHDDHVNITFVTHGSIRDFMIPASCLLPLPTITDVLLYSPWNCVIYADTAYGVATGRMKPEHRVFTCSTKTTCKTPDEEHIPKKLPKEWNSMKEAGDQKIPNILLSPLNPPEDLYWKVFEQYTKEYGPPGKNHIVIPVILPAEKSESVPFSVFTLALSLVLLSSRFKATVHLAACLGDRSTGQKFDKDYLKKQYACAVNETGMKCSPEMFSRNPPEILKSG